MAAKVAAAAPFRVLDEIVERSIRRPDASHFDDEEGEEPHVDDGEDYHDDDEEEEEGMEAQRHRGGRRRRRGSHFRGSSLGEESEHDAEVDAESADSASLHLSEGRTTSDVSDVISDVSGGQSLQQKRNAKKWKLKRDVLKQLKSSRD